MSPTQKYNFLKRNLGKWSWHESDAEYFHPDGTKFVPGGYFCFGGICYHGKTLDEAIEMTAETLVAMKAIK